MKEAILISVLIIIVFSFFLFISEKPNRIIMLEGLIQFGIFFSIVFVSILLFGLAVTFLIKPK